MIDELELTKLFIEYSETKKKLEEAEAKISAAILELGESRNVAGVKATYYSPSTLMDYETSAKRTMPNGFDLSPFTKTTDSVSWKSVCDALGVDGIPGEEKPARVTIK